MYARAFPDAELREDPALWLRLLSASPPLGPPIPLIEVVLLVDARDTVCGGATVEFYRTAQCGLLTYLAVDDRRAGQGLGRRLVGEATMALCALAGFDPPLFAETERHEDAADAHEADQTALRQRRLHRLGARMVDLDYVMPPLRAGLPPRRLHLMVFDSEARPAATVDAAVVRRLVEELAGSLDADLDAHDGTRAMVRDLEARSSLAVLPLPYAGGRDA